MTSANLTNTLLVVGILLVVSISLIVSEQNDATKNEATTRSKFKLPKFFDFGWFTTEFGKVYPTMGEYLVRKKVYLGNLMKIFVSQLAFKRERSTYFLRVNQMSDKTPDEIDQIYSNSDMLDGLVVERSEAPKKPVKVQTTTKPLTPIGDLPADLTDIEAQLEEIVEHRNESEVLEAIAEEVSTSDEQHLSRRKRDVRTSHVEPEPEPTPFWKTVMGQFWDKLTGPKMPPMVYSDLRTTKCFNPIRSQGDCGSCYIFALLSLLEYQHCIETGELLEFSPQYPLDCGQDRVSVGGCNGGAFVELLKFVLQYGLELESDYFYTSRSDTCPYPQDYPSYKMGRLRTNVLTRMVRIGDYEADKFAINVPMLISMRTSRDFHHYGGGVHNPGEACRKDRNHGMVVVGIGSEDGLEYFLIRNSHSEYFGEKGYYKLALQSMEHCVNSFSTTTGLHGRSLPLIKDRDNMFRDASKVSFAVAGRKPYTQPTGSKWIFDWGSS